MRRSLFIFMYVVIGILLISVLKNSIGVSYAQTAHQQELGVFPKLTGQYQVGKVDYDLIDHTRKEIFVDDPKAQREILVSVYYPANPEEGAKPAPFASGKLLEIFSSTYGVSTDFIEKNLQPHAFTAAPLAKTKEHYPVIIFSPGWGANPLLYTPTLEDLASQGYIVMAIWHPYSCDFTVFPDGRVVLANKAGSDPDHYPDEQSQQTEIRERVGGVWIGDARFILDQLTRLNQIDRRFAQHIDIEHVGMFGHSFGGTVSLTAAGLDNRIKAAADVDGGLEFGQPEGKGLAKPMLLMRSDDVQLTDKQLAQLGITRQQYEEVLAQQNTYYHTYYEHSDPGYLFQLKGSAHETYASLLAVVAPLIPDQVTKDVVGTINGQRAVYVYDTYLEAFFNKYLKQKAEPLLKGPSKAYPEVKFEAHQ